MKLIGWLIGWVVGWLVGQSVSLPVGYQSVASVCT